MRSRPLQVSKTGLTPNVLSGLAAEVEKEFEACKVRGMQSWGLGLTPFSFSSLRTLHSTQTSFTFPYIVEITDSSTMSISSCLHYPSSIPRDPHLRTLRRIYLSFFSIPRWRRTALGSWDAQKLSFMINCKSFSSFWDLLNPQSSRNG